jgi:hypothetical protein
MGDWGGEMLEMEVRTTWSGGLVRARIWGVKV